MIRLLRKPFLFTEKMKNNTNLIIRLAAPEDILGILEIYAYYVQNTAITFEYTIPSLAEFQNRYDAIMQKYPFWVAVIAGEIVGYAYAGRFIVREAYNWTAELSVYVKHTMLKKGIGKALYTELEKILYLQNVQICYACIAYSDLENDPYINNTSIVFHQKSGYTKIGDFMHCGYKFERWYHMCFMEKRLVSTKNAPKPFIPFSKLRDSMEKD